MSIFHEISNSNRNWASSNSRGTGTSTLKKKEKRKKELTCINNLPEISITKTIKKELKNLKVKHPFK